jgi:hypothetical protein
VTYHDAEYPEPYRAGNHGPDDCSGPCCHPGPIREDDEHDDDD